MSTFLTEGKIASTSRHRSKFIARLQENVYTTTPHNELSAASFKLVDVKKLPGGRTHLHTYNRFVEKLQQ